jgi:hypothetical protein
MDVREKLVELLFRCSTQSIKAELRGEKIEVVISQGKIADYLIAHGVTVQECAKPLEEWGEDYGDVLWWKFPIEEPPYVGSPLDANWPAYHTHWTTIPMPQPPKGE